MRSAIRPYIDYVAAIDILIGFMRILSIPESFRRWPIFLAMSLRAMLCALRHSHIQLLMMIVRLV
jgi:hypothetical protein